MKGTVILIWSMEPCEDKANSVDFLHVGLRTLGLSKEKDMGGRGGDQELRSEELKLNCPNFKVCSRLWPASKSCIIVMIEKCFPIPNTFIQI